METQRKVPRYDSFFGGKYQNIIYEKDGYVARITLNRPDKRNPLDRAVTLPELNDAISMAEWDDNVKVLILKGAGAAFSAGFDLSEVGFMYGMKEPKPGETVRRPSLRIKLLQDRYILGETMRHVLFCHKTTIAQIHGYCLGGGLMMAEKCDIIIGAEDCKIGFVEERLGTGGMTMSPTLIARVGLTKALELQVSGKMITGKEAARINLINRAVPLNQLETEVDEFAKGVALYSRDGLACSKVVRQTVYESLGMGQWFATAYWSHSLMTNMQWEQDEYNFYKERRDQGVTKAAHQKDEFYKALDK
jgi:enoyl-CoA hydratase/carnithine racemase